MTQLAEKFNLQYLQEDADDDFAREEIIMDYDRDLVELADSEGPGIASPAVLIDHAREL